MSDSDSEYDVDGDDAVDEREFTCENVRERGDARARRCTGEAMRTRGRRDGDERARARCALRAARAWT